jgi:anti-anti-sigma regulatory factor
MAAPTPQTFNLAAAPTAETDFPVGSVDQRRRAALQAVAYEAAQTQARGDPVIATRTFADGCLAVGLGGEFDQASAQRLRDVLEQLRKVAVTELALDLGAVSRHHDRLPRVLGHARIRCLIDGVRFELHRLPHEIEHALFR